MDLNGGGKMNYGDELLHCALQAARAGAASIREAAAPTEWVAKGHNDWVTMVDQEAEEVIAGVLLTGVPGSKVVGEELSPELTRGGVVWVVDPLDGTTNYLHHYPWFAVSIAASVDGIIEAGVVVNIPRDEIFTAKRGNGAWFENQRLQVSTTSDPAQALIGTGFPFKHLHNIEPYLRQFRTIMAHTSGVRRAGSAALDLVDVAAGRFDGFWELMLAPWDTAAGILLVTEAGGRVTDLSGDQVGISHTGIVAGNPWIHEWLLEIISRQQDSDFT